MVQTMRDFITKNSNLSLKIVCVAVNNIQQVKMFTKLSWQIICDICAEEFLIFYCFILLNIRISKEIWFIKTIFQIILKVNTLTIFSIFEFVWNYILCLKKFDSLFLFLCVINVDLRDSHLLRINFDLLGTRRTSIIHNSEIIDFSKKCRVKVW